LRMVEREVRGKDGSAFLVRLHPYRSLDDRIEGVVVTFVDVSELKRTEERLRETERVLRLAEHAARAGVWKIDTIAGVIELYDELRPLLGLPTRVGPLAL